MKTELKSAVQVGFDLRTSFAPSGLVALFPFHPRLAPWAAFHRRFAAGFPVVSSGFPLISADTKLEESQHSELEESRQ